MDEEHAPVRMPFPGGKARSASRVLKGILLVTLSLLTIAAGIPTHALDPALDSKADTSPACPTNPLNSTMSVSDASFGCLPSRSLGGSRLAGNIERPDLSLPKTVISSVDNM